jgi:hypothetical protein
LNGDGLVEFKEFGCGLFLAIVMVVLFGLLIGTYGTYLGIGIAGFVTGLISGNEIMDGLFNGIFVGIGTGLILSIFALILAIIYGITAGLGAGLLAGNLGYGTEIYLIVVYIVLASICSLGGSLTLKLIRS